MMVFGLPGCMGRSLLLLSACLSAVDSGPTCVKVCAFFLHDRVDAAVVYMVKYSILSNNTVAYCF